ncbi:MAG: cytochrome b/b6 domain-containing protein [Rhodoferax sp.]|nr:cytochrome b/b6 domain-containing protein [Rhodoferax sp.]
MASTVRVWDLPTRLFHWLLTLAIVGLVVTAQLGGFAMDWHFRLGYTVLSLLLFRLVWGFVGGHWSRFSSFLSSPAVLLRYIKGAGQSKQSLGHNPLGALSVVAMLMFLALQVASGLFSDDEISAYGPLGKFVSSNIVASATYYHTQIGKLVLLALIALHLLAIGFYFFRKKTNLVVPMVFGNKESDSEVKSSRDDRVSRAIAFMIFLLCSALVALIVKLAG